MHLGIFIFKFSQARSFLSPHTVDSIYERATRTQHAKKFHQKQRASIHGQEGAQSRQPWPEVTATRKVIYIQKGSIPEAVRRRGTKGREDPKNLSLKTSRDNYWRERRRREAEKLRHPGGGRDISLWEVKIRPPRGDAPEEGPASKEGSTKSRESPNKA